MKQVLMWSPVGAPGAEYCEVTRRRTGWRLRGSVIAVAGDQPLLVDYQIACDATWRTRSVRVAMASDVERRSLRLTVKDGGWFRPTGEAPELRGCVDIDLGVTPATNTLPIRRLNLAIGASAHVTAAWAQFPSLELRPLAQVYTRLDERRYRYESDTGYRTELEVDDKGFVITYAGGWERFLSAE